MDNVTIGRFDFEWDESEQIFECRGEIMYDDEHDEIPEPALWEAAGTLRDNLRKKGLNALRSHSEKGWVEVVITED